MDNNTNNMITSKNNHDFNFQWEMAPVTPLLLSVYQVLVDCGVNNSDKFDGKNTTEMIYE